MGRSSAPFIAARYSLRDPRRGFTLVELLCVVFIVGMLLALLLPAIQLARESARQIDCKNHLHQLSLALELHEESQACFPSSGWGWKWPPYPDHGDGDRQPGSWVYCVLPNIEAGDLHSSAVTNEVRLTTVLPMFYCPSRRAAELYPCTNTYVLAPLLPRVAKSDYAANSGDHDNPNAPGPGIFVQPVTLDDGDQEAWWQGLAVRNATGLIFQRSSVRVAEITDGTSHTYLVGEKYLNPHDYETGAGLGDMESVYHGDNDDTSRVTYLPDGPPRQDSPGLDSRSLFGSAHPRGCNFAMADGAVRTIAYAIDAETHRRLGNRNDGLVVSLGGP